MKRLLLLLLIISPTLLLAQNKRIVLSTGDPRYPQVYYTNVATQVNPLPGDTIVIPTKIHSFLLQHFNGTAAKPIIIIPQDSGWIGGYTSYASTVSYATYFKIMGFHIDGRGKDSSNLGMYIGEQTSFYEACNIEIKNSASEGFVAKADPDNTDPLDSYPNWTIQNASIHDIYVHNCVNEGFYIGYTNNIIKPLAPLFNNLSLYNLRADSCYYMGLVLSDAQNIHLHDITITHFGISNVGSYQNGIAVGYVTLADSAYNITINGGTGAGLLLFGKGLWKLRNWTITNTATTAGESAIYVDDRVDIGYNQKPLQLDFNNITIKGAAKNALFVANSNNTMVPGVINNLVYSGTAQGIFDQIDKVTSTSNPPPPKTIKSITVLYSDGTQTILP